MNRFPTLRSFFRARGLAIAALAVCAAMAAPSRAESWYETRHAAIEKELAALPPDTSGTILMLGDSITEQLFSNYPMPREMDGRRVVDEGIGGDTIGSPGSTTGVMARLDQVKRARPAIVFLMIGVNNLWDKKTPVEDTIKKYEVLIPRLEATVPDAKLVLQSVLPTRGSMGYVNPKVLALNGKIQQIAKKNHAVWLDLHTLMKDSKGELIADYTRDGVHPIAKGFDVWLKQIRATADRLLDSHQSL